MRTRLQQFLQAENLSPSRFADQIGIQRSGVSHILSGRNKPGFDFMEKMLLSYPSLNAEWFITGKGKMYKEIKTATLFTQEEMPAPATAPFAIPGENGKEANTPDEKILHTDTYNSSSEEEHKLVKVLFFYSDNTFTEYSPGDMQF
ncbi:MAG: helix-turn-helix transcriptional regulator [Bacteroidales bacterium]|jgi:transcriptional regulator with XRE-family HTH domain|nr:helix-turn-helix transcriptional regulator [Bacteroidales bacterium]MDD2264257.1 helix-turn-helix transcriptional regulator [Bacteroidales bacterium]MDD2831491.1 helix-turn-helix transcriptional regulator [Bacteroidales bacterium]MDD3208485.1 helix-turn-helix transcriptional regulator [Bacteroidales bacterium]MDD3697102.1 helix-turn-helix transcriptional regulator [Bacteroidales bacterium]